MSSTANPPLVACPSIIIWKGLFDSTVTCAGIHAGLVVSIFFASKLQIYWVDVKNKPFYFILTNDKVDFLTFSAGVSPELLSCLIICSNADSPAPKAAYQNEKQSCGSSVTGMTGDINRTIFAPNIWLNKS